MPVRRLGLEADFSFKVGPYKSPDLRVVRFEGREAVSEMFHFQLQLVLEDREADFDAVVGKPGLLTIEGSEGTRYVSGIVSRFEQSSEATRLTQYSAELVPKVWLLDNRRNSRIFQQMKVPDIIKKVLDKAKIPPDEYEFKLQRGYPEREYCVQYRESDLTFISRLLEEEGIFYWFQHSEDKHVFTMGDAPNIIKPITGDSKLAFYEVSGEEPDQEHVYLFRYSQEVRPGEVVLRDFDFKKPSLDLTSSKSAEWDMGLQQFDYPGEYVTPDVGKELSRIRLEEFQATRKRAFGRSTCRRFVPGYKHTLENHPRGMFNQEYLMLQVVHTGSQVQSFKEAAGVAQKEPEYRNHYRCIPADIPFRPPRITPRPVVHGSQTAIVVGPAGEEIHPDEHGRVKVQFHWDREGNNDEKSSCWIRVSQGWAGGSYGGIMVPRIGHEVIVDFLEGDPDRPIIIGRVYNGTNRVPYGLPGAKMVGGVKSNTTPGGAGYNEYIMDDTKGNELIRVHAQYNMDSHILHDLREHVSHDRAREVDNNEALKIGVDQIYNIGNNQLGEVGKNKLVKIGENFAEEVVKDKTLITGGTHNEKIGQNMGLEVQLNQVEKVGVNYQKKVGAAMEILVDSAMHLKVGAAMALEIGGTGISSIKGDSISKIEGKEIAYTKGDSLQIVEGDHVDLTVGKVTDVGGDTRDQITKGAHSILGMQSVKITALTGITLQTGASTIEMSPAGEIKISGLMIKIEGLAISSEASVANAVKGTIVQVEGSAMTAVKGGIVMIN
jgi:type VI secretion system secreted protein VgrG